MLPERTNLRWIGRSLKRLWSLIIHTCPTNSNDWKKRINITLKRGSKWLRGSINSWYFKVVLIRVFRFNKYFRWDYWRCLASQRLGFEFYFVFLTEKRSLNLLGLKPYTYMLIINHFWDYFSCVLFKYLRNHHHKNRFSTFNHFPFHRHSLCCIDTRRYSPRYGKLLRTKSEV